MVTEGGHSLASGGAGSGDPSGHAAPLAAPARGGSGAGLPGCRPVRRSRRGGVALAPRAGSSVKRELVAERDFWTRHQARGDIVDYIEAFYNRQRRHSALGQISPARFEEQLA